MRYTHCPKGGCYLYFQYFKFITRLHPGLRLCCPWLDEAVIMCGYFSFCWPTILCVPPWRLCWQGCTCPHWDWLVGKTAVLICSWSKWTFQACGYSGGTGWPLPLSHTGVSVVNARGIQGLFLSIGGHSLWITEDNRASVFSIELCWSHRKCLWIHDWFCGLTARPVSVCLFSSCIVGYHCWANKHHVVITVQLAGRR